MAQTKIVRISRPFTKGWVTDRPRWALDQQEMADGQDIFWPRGVAVQRRPWDYVQAQNPLGTSGILSSVIAVQFQPDSTTVSYVVTDNAGRVGIANTASAATAFTAQSTTYLPRAFYDGEVLLCPQDGISPIIRWSGYAGTVGNVASTSIAWARNTPQVTGIGTTFTTDLPVYSYLNIERNGNFGPNFRVEQVQSNTSVSLKTNPWMSEATSSPITVTPGALAFQRSPYGTLGLRVAVTGVGAATVSSSSTSLTGKATTWASYGQGYAPLASGDVIALLPQPATSTLSAIISTPDVGVVSSVTNATTATLKLAPGVSFSDCAYVALRSMPGKEICSHQGRLWITGVAWEPNRVYVTPISGSVIDARNNEIYNLGTSKNGENAYSSEFSSSVQAKYVDVPDRFSEGKIVGLLSGRNVLLVLRSNSCFGIFGAWPGITVEQIADGAGCVDVRATAVADDGLYWAGEEGIYRYVPGRGIEDITRERVNREWRRIMRDRSTSSIVSLGVINKHVLVSYLDGSAYGLGSGSQTSVTWVYDTVSNTWCGKASDIRARYMQTARLRGLPDDLFFIEGDSSVRRIGSLASAFSDDDSAPASGAQKPSMYAESGSILTGTATDSFRTIEMRVGYECEGSGSTLTVKTANDEDSPAATQATLAATSGDITTTRLRASTASSTSAALGKDGRQFGFRFEASGSDADRIALHEVQVTAREYGNRE